MRKAHTEGVKRQRWGERRARKRKEAMKVKEKAARMERQRDAACRGSATCYKVWQRRQCRMKSKAGRQ